jgi:hypothetical protein
MVGRNGPAGVGRVNSSTAVGMNGKADALFGRHISGGATRIRTVKSTSTGGNTATEAAPLAKRQGARAVFASIPDMPVGYDLIDEIGKLKL